MKILYVTTIGTTLGFFKELLRDLVKEGNTLDIATNDSVSKIPNEVLDVTSNVYHLSWTRNPLSTSNIIAYKQLKKIVRDNHYDIVHCHTPIAAALTRLACKDIRKDGTRVIYTAHGFHFFNGAPLKNWLIYYPIEKYCSRYTDVLITINREDYNRALSKFHCKDVRYIKGVGIDIDKFRSALVNKEDFKKELGIPKDSKVILSVGELNTNKNHILGIKALPYLDNTYYVICGEGKLKDYYLDIAKELKVEDRLKLVGYRNDVSKFYKISDVFLFPSFREGLSVSLMEAMSNNVPCITTKIRGNVDLLGNDYKYFIDSKDEKDLINKYKQILIDKDVTNKYDDTLKEYTLDSVLKEVKKIYQDNK